MHLYVCGNCFFALRVLNGSSEGGDLVGPLSDTWGKFHECPECSAEKMYGHPENAIDSELMVKLRVRDLEPTECFTALLGGGLPDEQDATPDEVEKALLSSPIKEVTVRPIKGTRRAVLDRLFLENGTRLYLGAGPQGAVVYRIAHKEQR